MRKIIIIALAILASASFNTAEAAKKSKKKEKTGAMAPVQLKNGSDSLSYAAGMSFTNGLTTYLKQAHNLDETYMADFLRGLNDMLKADSDPKMKAYAAGMEIAGRLSGSMVEQYKKEFAENNDTIVATILYRGFNDALLNDTTVFDLKEAEKLLADKNEANKRRKENTYLEVEKKFLAENATKDSVMTTPSGLQYKIIKKGTGDIPKANDEVLVHYEGRLLDGTVFDASRKHGDKPLQFRANQVIKGWTEALTMMPVGSRWQLFIPYKLAYGDRAAGQIKPYSTLIFDVELVGINKK
ncbi:MULTISPECIES: FKBP-type peptidyl-prolyl cis-trans isomerase [unclassified Prevotella]|uniref:FKBP-type peptidyl-prolyl cis-trans isomerase n=1 Tax=unclassified Prevotella TaxID=2638335 RepID=UPI000CE9AFE6|nr:MULTISPECIES: FKBP-type peptidyl-prolyl cis-trans isomerase [unclassified Prevotella]NPD53865.1 FKBP-type peptidyl-prolyl cis-trans isomerase [Prevotella sp. PTAC]GAY26954.1 FKBP-type peptidyl-prolyl cis-trans isomerase FklB [Prevotella sp. MGM1]